MSDQEKMIHGIPERLFDGYDGGSEPPAEFIEKLMAGAPAYIKERAAEVEKQRTAETSAKKD